eukprot:6761351-Lingulodinium_polyedra.AAC.1
MRSGGTTAENDLKVDPETDRRLHPYPEMPLNWWPPIDFNLNDDWRQIPKKWQPATPERTDDIPWSHL